MRKIIQRLKIKQNRHRGFTLAETLIAVLILLMVSAVVAAGIPVAANAYRNVVVASNAEVLLSTTISALRNALGDAADIKVYDDETTISYYNRETGWKSMIYLQPKTDDSTLPAPVGTIMYQEYAPEDGISYTTEAKEEMETSKRRLISSKTSTDDLYVTYTSADYKNGVVTFSNLEVKQQSAAPVGNLPKRAKLSIKVL